MTENTFAKLETDIMKVLTRTPGEYVSQYRLYNSLLEDLEIKDPLEKDNLKIRFLIVLRQLSNIFNDITIVNKNNLLYAIFSPTKDESESDTDKSDTDKSDTDKSDTDKSDSDGAYEKIPKTEPIEKKEPEKVFEKVFEKEPETNECTMPSEISVINFIIDQDLNEFFYRKDYKGNTILHHLVLNNDYERIKNNFNLFSSSYMDTNNDGLTPIDMITDVRINNLFMKHIIRLNIENKQIICHIRCHIDSLNEIIKINTNLTNTFMYIIVLQFVYSFFLK